MRRLIIFKTECNNKIGFGHLKRCLNYALMLAKKNEVILIVTKISLQKNII